MTFSIHSLGGVDKRTSFIVRESEMRSGAVVSSPPPSSVTMATVRKNNNKGPKLTKTIRPDKRGRKTRD